MKTWSIFVLILMGAQIGLAQASSKDDLEEAKTAFTSLCDYFEANGFVCHATIQEYKSKAETPAGLREAVEAAIKQVEMDADTLGKIQTVAAQSTPGVDVKSAIMEMLWEFYSAKSGRSFRLNAVASNQSKILDQAVQRVLEDRYKGDVSIHMGVIEATRGDARTLVLTDREDKTSIHFTVGRIR